MLRLLLIISLSLALGLSSYAQQNERFLGLNTIGGLQKPLSFNSKQAIPFCLEFNYRVEQANRLIYAFYLGAETASGDKSSQINDFQFRGIFNKAYIGISNPGKSAELGFGLFQGYQKQSYVVNLGGERFSPYTQSFGNSSYVYGVFFRTGFIFTLSPSFSLAPSLSCYILTISNYLKDEKVYHVAGAGPNIGAKASGSSFSFRAQVNLLYRLNFSNRQKP